MREGQDCPKILVQFGGAIQGILWHTQTYFIHIKLDLNLSKKVQKTGQGQLVTAMMIHKLKKAILTRRIMMLQIYGIDKSLGLLSPILIKYKIAFQRMVF